MQNRESPGRADPARPGQAARRDGQEEVAQHPDDRQPVLARRDARQPLPEQLRDDPASRRAGPAPGRRRHHLSRPARLQHAGLARSRQDVVPQPDGDRRLHGDRAAEHPGRRRPDRPAAGAQRPGLPVHDDAPWAGSKTPSSSTNIILKTDTDGRIVRLKDVARIELGAQGYDQTCTLDGKPSVALSIYQRPGSNALETADLVRDKMEELKKRFPGGHRLRDRLRHDAVHHRVGQRRSSRPCATR